MQRRYNIKWRPTDEKELAKAVRKFNAKRTRLLKQVPELEDFLPAKKSVKEIRSNITTRQDFKREINSIERFMRKGAEKPIVTKEGIKTTQYEKRELQIKVRQINKRRKQELKLLNPSIEKGNLHTVQELNLAPQKFNLDKMKKSDWEGFKRRIDKQSRSSYYAEKYERYKKNYMKGIENVFGPAGESILELVRQMAGEELTKAFYNDVILEIDFIYDPIDMQAKIDAIIERLNKYIPSS